MLCVDAALSHFLSYSAPHSSTPSLACFCTRKNKYAFTPQGSLSLRVSYPCCRGSAPGAGITSPEPQWRLRASRARIHPNPHLASLFFFFFPTPQLSLSERAADKIFLLLHPSSQGTSAVALFGSHRYDPAVGTAFAGYLRPRVNAGATPAFLRLSPSPSDTKQEPVHVAWFGVESRDLTWFACGFHPKL